MKIYLIIIFSTILLKVYGQAEDHFNDGDFTNSPVWSGENSDFIINTALQLQLNAASAGNSFLSVHANLSSLDSCEWRFFIRLDFSPSSSNFARVYLSADQQDLQQPLNGYFLQFGESLSNDAVELFRQNGTTLTSICRGQNGLIANSFSAGLKVTRSVSGLFTISTDYNGGVNYTVEVTGTDTVINSAGMIGVNCVYTSGNINRFYFDDFYAGPEIPDTILPYVSAINAESDSVLSVTFSEKMDNPSLIDINNYSTNNGINNPSFIMPDSTNTLRYFLHFSSHFQPGLTYMILFSGLKDISQNIMTNQNKTFIYSPLMIASLNDVVISEVYFEPSSLSPLPNSEFIEIYNRKDSTILLSGWKISDGSSIGEIPAYRLGPHNYVVLHAENDSAEFISISNALEVHSFPTLNNDVGDHLFLSDNAGEIIDELNFNDEYYHDNNKNDGGWSIERIDPDFTCKNANNWEASISNLHGTPGLINSVKGVFTDLVAPYAIGAFLIDSNSVSVNFSEAVSEGSDDTYNYQIKDVSGNILIPASVNIGSDDSVVLYLSSPFASGIYSLQISTSVNDCPGNSFESNHTLKFGFPENAEPKDILINELLFNSYEGGNDFLEIYNRSRKIIDLKDWEIAEADYKDSSDIKEIASITKGHRLFFPGEYLVLTEDEKKIKSFYTYEDEYSFLNVTSIPDFNSDDGRAIIYDKYGNTIDAFRYNDDMHFPLLTETRGISLERLSVEQLTDDSQNWHSAAATAGFATPGYGNSQVLGLVSGDGEVTVGMEIFSPDDDGYSDVLAIHYNFTQAGTVLSLNVYDYNGLPVRTLLSGQTVGNEGMICWDGLTDEKVVAPGGIYIILAKSFDLDGSDHVFKKTCFLTRRF